MASVIAAKSNLKTSSQFVDNVTVYLGHFKRFYSITANEQLAKGVTPKDVIKVLSLSLATTVVVAVGQELI